jgi:hypothetical protein
MITWAGPYPVVTRAQMRAGLDLLPTWVLELKAAAFSAPGIALPMGSPSLWDLAFVSLRQPSRPTVRPTRRRPHHGVHR